jgi:hypothetical protein
VFIASPTGISIARFKKYTCKVLQTVLYNDASAATAECRYQHHQQL